MACKKFTETERKCWCISQAVVHLTHVCLMSMAAYDFYCQRFLWEAVILLTLTLSSTVPLIFWCDHWHVFFSSAFFSRLCIYISLGIITVKVDPTVPSTSPPMFINFQLEYRNVFLAITVATVYARTILDIYNASQTARMVTESGDFRYSSRFFSKEQQGMFTGFLLGLGLSLMSRGIISLDSTLLTSFAFVMILTLVVLQPVWAVLFVVALGVFYQRTPHGEAVVAHLNELVLMIVTIHLFLECMAVNFFSANSRLERMKPFLLLSWYTHLFLLLLFLGLEVLFCGYTLFRVTDHKENLVVVPMSMAAAGLLWLPSHLGALVMCYKLISRVSRCRQAYLAVRGSSGEREVSLSVVMASQGLRSFAYAGSTLMDFALLANFLLLVISWTTMTHLSLSLFLGVEAVECFLSSLMGSMSANLHCTAAGQAFLSPLKNNPPGHLSSFKEMEVSMSQSHGTSIKMERFFHHHLVEPAIDQSTTRFSLEAVLANLRGFFEKTTTDGVRYDTYLLYYFGPTTACGSWLMLGDSALTFKSLLDLWDKTPGSGQSRLLLVSDVQTYPKEWVADVRGTKRHCVAIQTFQYSKEANEEGVSRAGLFTSEWVTHNDPERPLLEKGYQEEGWQTMPFYALSPSWMRYKMAPSDEELYQYVYDNYPQFTHAPITSLLMVRRKLMCCLQISHFFRAIKYGVYLPKQLNIGHTFKLYRS